MVCSLFSSLFLWLGPLVPLACSAVRGGGSPRHGDELQQGLFEMWGGCSNIFKCTPADCILHIPYMDLAKAFSGLGCSGTLDQSVWVPHRPCASLGQEGQRQLGLVQLILTWQGRYNDQEGCLPRARL